MFAPNSPGILEAQRLPDRGLEGPSGVGSSSPAATGDRNILSGFNRGVQRRSRGTRSSKSRSMAFTRVYKLYTGSVATASAATSLTIPRSGTITSINASCAGSTGAGATNTIAFELSTSSVSTVTTNDTPGNSICTLVAGSNVASSAYAGSLSQQGMAVPVQAGDKLFLHIKAGTITAGDCYFHIAIAH